MRPKCTLVDEDGALAIGKFPSVNDARSVTRGEVLALQLALHARVTAAPARIVLLGEIPVAVIRRFGHGFLHVGRGLWRLAPAFDVNPFPDKDRESKTWLSEQDGPITDLAMLLARADYFALNADQATSILAEVHAAVSAWRQVALGPQVGLRPVELEDFAPAFEHAQMEQAAKWLRR